MSLNSIKDTEFPEELYERVSDSYPDPVEEDKNTRLFYSLLNAAKKKVLDIESTYGATNKHIADNGWKNTIPKERDINNPKNTQKAFDMGMKEFLRYALNSANAGKDEWGKNEGEGYIYNKVSSVPRLVKMGDPKNWKPSGQKFLDELAKSGWLYNELLEELNGIGIKPSVEPGKSRNYDATVPYKKFVENKYEAVARMLQGEAMNDGEAFMNAVKTLQNAEHNGGIVPEDVAKAFFYLAQKAEAKKALPRIAMPKF